MCPGPPGLLPQGPAPSRKRFEKRCPWAADTATLAAKSQKEAARVGGGREAGRLGMEGRDREKPGRVWGYRCALLHFVRCGHPRASVTPWTEQLFAGKGRESRPFRKEDTRAAIGREGRIWLRVKSEKAKQTAQSLRLASERSARGRRARHVA